MGIIRLLILFLLAWLLWRLFKPLWQRPPRDQQGQRDGVQPTVRCHYCQLNLPRDEALQDGEYYFCSAEHRQLHRQRQE